MKQAGQIVLTPFPHTDLSGAKLRPVLMLRPASRLAVLDGELLAGSIGVIGNERLARLRLRLAKWIASDV